MYLSPWNGPNVINANYTLLHASASRAAAQATLEEKLHYKPDPFSLEVKTLMYDLNARSKLEKRISNGSWAPDSRLKSWTLVVHLEAATNPSICKSRQDEKKF